MSIKEIYEASRDYEKKHRFDNKHPKIRYYAFGMFFNESLFVYQEDKIWGGNYWVQSGYRSLEQLKKCKDFQVREQEHD